MKRVVRGLLVGCLALAAVPLWAKADDKIWVELSARQRRPIKIPSLAPLVKEASQATLVVSIEGTPDLPEGHPALPHGGPGGMMMGQGSGFIIHPSGYALTNNHVIANADTITVSVGTDHVEYDAEVIGTDEKTDVALIHIKSDRKDWPVIPLGASEDLEVGDFVVAIGNPFGLAQTVSMGILSARGRRDINPSRQVGLYDFLQTDASINPGNSGGPLLNLAGEAVGINTAINAAAQGIGFAIPIDMVKHMLGSLRQEGRVVRSWIGISIQRVSGEMANAFGLDRPMGALVRQVVEGGPGAAAGLQAGDVITHFEGRPIEEANVLPLVAGDAGVDKMVKLTVVRDRKARIIEAKLGEHPDNQPRRGEGKKAAKKDAKSPAVGLKVVTLNEDDRVRLDFDKKVQGVRVIEVKPGSAAFRAGLATDDVIVQLNSKLVADAKDFKARAGQVKPGGILALSVLRGQDRLFLAVIKP